MFKFQSYMKLRDNVPRVQPNPIKHLMAALEGTMSITVELTNQNKILSETMPIKYQASTRNRIKSTQHNTTQYKTTQDLEKMENSNSN
jgi:hypothetical protein